MDTGFDNPKPEPTPEPLSGQETAKGISEMYEIIGPVNGCQLVEPTAVLAVAGLKGYTFLVDAIVNQEEKDNASKLNSQLEQKGLHVGYSDKLNQMTISNLRGLEYKTKRTKLPGFFPYSSNSGFSGKNRWHWEVDKRIELVKQQGVLSSDVETRIYEEAVMFGYPDQAAIDFEECLRTGDINKDLISSDIELAHPDAKKYKGPSSDFDYYPSSAKDPEIIEYISKAKQIIQDFYNSEWFVKISQDPNFIAAREAQNLRHKMRIDQLLSRRKQKS
ncbi:hypothetical protein C4577_01330 [Candidatus Parcubacteria bacterium]|nr:MAG: hypothetical protein C4577_01330 [Candidatus Parcubacteria bacterium]